MISNRLFHGFHLIAPTISIQFPHRFIDESAKYTTKTWLERVIVVGLDKIPKAATARSSDSQSQPLEIIDATKHSFTIRKPAVSMMDKWSITLNF
jgi:mannosyl-oligosaccharide alpha-1,3-glucosidase